MFDDIDADKSKEVLLHNILADYHQQQECGMMIYM
jgi:hypothetical protein